MNRLTAALAACATMALAGLVRGDSNVRLVGTGRDQQGAYLRATLPVTGTYTLTNAYSRPWKIVNVWWTQPAVVTNTLSITNIHRFVTFTDGGGTIVTNEFGNQATNYLHAITETTVTQSVGVASVTVTNSLSTVLDTDDLPKDLYYVVGADLLQFTFSRTNLTYLNIIGAQ